MILWLKSLSSMVLTGHTNLAYRQITEMSCLCWDTTKGLFQSEPDF